ncbi:MAG: cell filamentation protein [Phenylobacterium sp.]|jgi:cell filamentation protein
MSNSVYPDSVEPEFYPGTNVFINLLSIQDAKKLSKAEADFTAIRTIELLQQTTLLPQIFDFNHLKAIHCYLFQDLYCWAGKPRSYDVKKGHNEFTPASFLPKYEKQVFCRAIDFHHEPARLNKSLTAKRLASCLGIINIFHPFVEGNGRTQRVFISALANQFDYSVNWSEASPWEIVETSKQVHVGNYEPLEWLMKRILVDGAG